MARRERIPLRRKDVLVLLVALTCAKTNATRYDLPSQFYKAAQGPGAKLEPLAFRPSPLPDSVTRRLRGIPFENLSIPLQHALLWDVGLVATGDNTSYVQIKVPCSVNNTAPAGMNEIFLTRDTVSDPKKGNCGLVSCNALSQHAALSNCSFASIERQTKCGIMDTVNPLSSNPFWMEDGELDSQTFIRVYRKEQTIIALPRNRSTSSSSSDLDDTVGSVGGKTTTLYTIIEKNGLNVKDYIQSCPNKPTFIIPCRQITAETSSSWCDPTPGQFVDLWISQELAQRNSKSVAKHDEIIITLFVCLFGLATVVAIGLAAILWRRRQHGKGSLSSGAGVSGMLGSSELMDHDMLLTHHHHLLTSDGSEHNTHHTSFLNETHVAAMSPAELDKINAQFCERSVDLAEFCDDHELTMKRIPYSSLQYLTLIARGANGEVWRGEYGSQDVAIKRLLRDKQTEIMSMELFAREIRLASTLEHPNIVRFIGVSWRSLSEMCMVSEFMPSGDLAHYLLSKESRNLSWPNEKMTLALDIANALVYLHSLMPVIIHRDFKSLNILLNENLEAKLSDFGLSRERSFEETMTSGVGTLLWTAPEVLRGDRYTEKADIYSYGIVLSELDTCLPPYSLNEEVAQSKQKSMQLLPLIRTGQIKPQFRENVPPALYDLAQACLDYVPERRPNAMQIVYILRSRIMPTLS